MASNAAREIRCDPQRLLDDTPHLPIGNLHGVTICRELRHSDQIMESNTVRRIGRSFLTAISSPFLFERDYPRPGQAWGRVAEWHGVNVSPMASNAAREIRCDPQRLLDDTPHLPNRKLTRCHHLPRIKAFRSNKLSPNTVRRIVGVFLTQSVTLFARAGAIERDYPRPGQAWGRVGRSRTV